MYDNGNSNNNNMLNYQLQNKNYSQIARFFVIKSVDEDNIHKVYSVSYLVH
jgi:hypothetical protein